MRWSSSLVSVLLLSAPFACFACKQADFSGSGQTAGPGSAAANASGSAGASSPVGNTTNAGSSGGVSPLSNSTTTSTTTATTPGATPSSGSLLNTLAGVLGAAGSVAGSAIQAATPQPPANMNPCSQVYLVPGTANPYMAGEPSGTTITYSLSTGDGPNPTDTTAADSPVQVQPTSSNCIVPGNSIYFFVYGSITYAASVAPVNANGNLSEILQHQKGALFGKSNIQAPLCALIGVFLDDNDPTNNTAPGGLDFTTQAARDYTSLSPSLGQIFFIGTGLTSSGASHQIVVPTGATRLYLAAMDTYQWNNNIGGVNAQLMVMKSN